MRRPLDQRWSLFGVAAGETYLIDKARSTRERQDGGRLEAGVRIEGLVAALELFGGVQRMVDADPLDRITRSWGYAGFRLVGKSTLNG